jgi:transposase
VVLRQDHRPGEKLFLDWAGATIPIHHRGGSVTQAPLFVSALGVSSYTYAEAVTDQQMANWLKVQMNALEFYDGCPRLLIPDNTKTGVTRACIYEPDLNPTYQEFAIHYRVAVMPTRPRKPRDKADRLGISLPRCRQAGWRHAGDHAPAGGPRGVHQRGAFARFR